MAYHESIILTLFDIVSYILISKKLLEIKKFYWKDLVPVVILTFLVASGSHIIPDQYNFLLSAILLIITMLIYFKLTLFQSFMLYVISVIIIIVIQLIAILPTYLIFGRIEATFIPGLVAQSIGLAAVLVCYRFLPVHLLYRLTGKKNKIIKILLLNIFVLVICVLFYWYLNIEGMIENIITFVSVSLLLVILNGVIISNGLRNEQEEKELIIYKKYMPVIENLTDDIRKRQHDFSNHVQAIKAIPLLYDDINTVREKMDLYCAELNDDIENKELLLLDNKILAGFLFSKFQEAKEKDISIRYNLSNVKFKLMDFEFIEILSILLDNAVEACESGEEVQLSLYCKMGFGTIEVVNPTEPVGMDELDNFFKKGYSTKAPGKRGYGLSRLSDIVKKYNGEIEVKNENKEKQQNNVVFLVRFS
ncbi:MAG: GHKL domain-containing protein [Clostridia bacterium]|nr:GHKL domain-containing protein [Clostridia bacterium]